MLIGQIGRDDRQVILLGRTNNMDWPSFITEFQQEATGASHIVGIVFYDFTLRYHAPNLSSANHPLSAQHLVKGVRS